MNNLKQIVFAIALITTCAASALHAQNTCNSATAITVGVPSNDSLAIQTQNWYYFIAASANPRVTVVQDNPAAGNVHSILGYTGTCGNLQANGTPVRDTIPPVDTLIFNFQNVALGDTCFFTVERQDPVGCRTCNFLPYAKYQVSVTNSSVVCFLVIDPPSQTICVGEFAVVTNNSFPSNPSDPCFPNYYWTMPGGNPSTFLGFQPPPIQYSSVGTYTVTLYEVDSQGNINYLNFVTATVIVEPQHTASFTYTPTTACALEDITFTYTGFNPQSVIPYLEWDFGDGNTIGCNPFACPYTTTHAYQTPGTYTVTVCAYYGSCDTTCASQVITIPDGNISFSYVSTCRVKFTGSNTCIGTIISETWNFGDNSPIVSGSNPTHTYAQNGVPYTVTYTVVSTTGTYTYTATVIQQGGPVANIQGFAVNSCGNGSINYTANPCVPGVVYSWVATGGTASNLTGCSTDVSWTNPNGGSLQLIAFDPIEDCSTSVIIIIPPCCFGTAAPSSVTYINNLTASQFIAAQNNNNVYSNTNQTIINGVFTVDADFTFLNCPDIWMGPNAAIIVQPGHTLTIDNSKVIGKCQYMWDGIYIQGTLATLNVINNSFIEQAKQAIVSDNGGVYLVQNSTLRNNLRGIVVNAYSGFHTGIVRATTFSMTSNFLPAIPALPPAYTKTICAIEIYDNASITIGDPTSTALQNTFNNVFVGVRSNNSNTSVFNGRFTNITASVFQTFNIANAGTAIVATGRRNVSYQASLTVGAQPFSARCNIINVRNGIDVRGLVNTSVQYNNIREIRNVGVRVALANGRTISVQNNTISNQTVNYGFSQGIALVDVPNAWVTVTSNTILQTSSVPNQLGTGIYLACVTPATVFGTIANHTTLARVRTGIHLINIQGKYAFTILSNSIAFTKPNNFYTTEHSGIRLEGCATIRVDNNTVSKGGANPNAAMVTNLSGISITNSPITIATNNQLTKMGSGIMGVGVSTSSTLACNTMNFCYNGVFFTGSQQTNFACDIGNQIIDANGNPAATGNSWNGTIVQTGDINGFVSPSISWYWDVNQPSNGNPNAITLLQSTNNVCSSLLTPIQQVVAREIQAGYPIRHSRDTGIQTEHQYQLQRHAFRQLHKSPQLLFLNTPDDTLYQNFYNIGSTTNIGLQQQIELAADSGDYLSVQSLCGAMACANLAEHNNKIVLEKYSNSWMQDELNFSSADSSILYNIAIQDPVAGGDAVYSARVLLNLSVDINSSSGQRLGQEEPTNYTAADLLIYPNPTQSAFTIVTPESRTGFGQVLVFDNMGRAVLNQQINLETNIHSFSAEQWPAGLYWVRLTVEEEVIRLGKISVIK